VAKCNKTEPQKFVNDLLSAVYTDQYLASHSLGGKSSRMSVKVEIPPNAVSQLTGLLFAL